MRHREVHEDELESSVDRQLACAMAHPFEAGGFGGAGPPASLLVE
jgi:hypothetical protein